MGNEKYVFDEEELRCGFEDYLSDNGYFDYYTIHELVDNSLKKNGLSSRYIYLVQPLNQCNKDAELLQINAYENKITEFSEIQIFNAYIGDNYKLKMQDPDFAKKVYEYAEENYKYDYNRFVDLRKNYGDAYEPEVQEERER